MPMARPGALSSASAIVAPRVAQPREKLARPQLVQQRDRRHVERLLQGDAGAHLALERQVEILRRIIAEMRASVLQHRFGMREPAFKGHRVDERFQRGAGRANGAGEIDAACAFGGEIIGAADMGAYLAADIVDRDDGDRKLRTEARRVFARQRFELRLQARIERQAQHVLRGRAAQRALGRVRREHGKGFAHLRRGVAHRRLRFRARQCAAFDGAGQNAVARAPGVIGMAIRPSRLRRLWQRDEQRRFRVAQAFRLLAEIGEARRAQAFEIAAIGRETQIKAEDFVLAVGVFQLHGAHDLPRLGRQRAFVARFEQARNLHRQRRTAGDDAALTRPLQRRATHRDGIDAAMGAKAAIFVSIKQAKEFRIDGVGAQRQAPASVRRREGAQQSVVAIERHGGAACGARYVERPQRMRIPDDRAGAAERDASGSGKREAPEPRHARPAHQRFSVTSIAPAAVRPNRCGRYMSSIVAGGRT